LIDILYGGHKSDAGAGVDFLIDMDFTSPQRCEACPQPPVQWEAGALSLGVKRLGREADHSFQFCAEVKEGVELYPHSPNTPSWRVAQLNARDKLTRNE